MAVAAIIVRFEDCGHRRRNQLMNWLRTMAKASTPNVQRKKSNSTGSGSRPQSGFTTKGMWPHQPSRLTQLELYMKLGWRKLAIGSVQNSAKPPMQNMASK